MRRPELVVMGASWGGLEAVGRVLAALPPDFPLPIAVVQHRSPQPAGGGLADVLGARSALPVREAEDKDSLERGTVHLAPADYHLLVEPGTLALSTDERVRHARPSIDVLFVSAADTYADRLVAVLLTGANEDGADGLRRVRDRDGLALVQEPATAAAPAMPAAAIAAGAVDRVLTLEAIASDLVDLACRPRLLRGVAR